VADRLFSPEEVEALIPALTALVEQLRDAQADMEEARSRMEEEDKRLTLVGGGLLDRDGRRRDRDRLDAATERAHSAVDGIHRTGGVPKDVRLGLVDFPHLRDGRIVNLCWKHGETRIRYWHGLDEGYAARKPL
jgi:hypothetical protein